MKVNVDTRTFVRFWLVLIGFALGLLLIYQARTALILLGISLFLALALNLPVSKIARVLPGKSRVGASALAYILVVALLGVFIFAVVPPIVDQSIRFAKTIPSVVEQAGAKEGFINTAIEQYNLREQYDSAVKSVKNNIGSLTASVGSNIVNGAGSVVSAVVNLILVLIFTFFMLIEGPRWLQRIWAMYKDETKLKRHKVLAQRLYSVVTGYVNGQITVAAIAAAVSTLVVVILSFFFNVPINLSLAVAAIIFVLELIPMFGATIGALIAALLLFFNDPWAAVWFLGFYVVYQQFENGFVSPTVQGKAVEISGLTVLASVTIGVTLFGLLGGILAIPVAGCIRILFLDYLDENRTKRLSRDRIEKLAKKSETTV